MTDWVEISERTPDITSKGVSDPAEAPMAQISRESNMKIWPGKPYPLGTTYDGVGTNFSLFSEIAETSGTLFV